MREDICTIPVSEVFEPEDGCPICRLRNRMEEQVVDYILGAAMMEPDVRQKTNELGFCGTHLHMMQKKRNRLALALMLESHLDHLAAQIFGGTRPALLKPSAKKQNYRAAQIVSTCFVCDRMEWGMQRMLDTVCRMYESDADFRRLYDRQPTICLPHFTLLAESAEKKMSKRWLPEFQKSTSAIVLRNLKELRGDVRHFCDMFDYRNATEDADWGNAKDSIERTVWMLTSRE